MRRLTVLFITQSASLASHCQQQKREFNGTSTHVLDGYISANQRFFSTFLSKITKYNRVPLGFDPSVVRLLGRDPTPQTNLSGPLSTTSKNDPHLEERTISIAMDNTELLITNVYIPPASSCNDRYSPPIDHVLTGTYSLVLGYFNAHHSLWNSGTTDTRGNQLAHSVSISSFAVIDTDSPTRLPGNADPSSPDVPLASASLITPVRMANTHDHELIPSAHPYRIIDNCHLITYPAQNLHQPQEG